MAFNCGWNCFLLAKTTEDNWSHSVDFQQVGLCRVIVLYRESTDPAEPPTRTLATCHPQTIYFISIVYLNNLSMPNDTVIVLH